MYQVHGQGASRLLVVPAVEASRWKFFTVADVKGVATRQAVKFTRAGSRAVAVVSDTVLVYKKPHASAFHYEYMQANRGALSRGEPGADSDRILDNMLEYIEAI